MIFQVFLAFLGLSAVRCLPLDGLLVNGPVSDQGFYYNYQIQPKGYYPNDLSRPLFNPELGLAPQYHDLVYNYVKNFAGTEAPVHVNTFQPNIIYSQDQTYSQVNGPIEDKVGAEMISSVNVDTTDKPGLNEYYPPSDFLTLPNTNTRFYGHLNEVKLRRTEPNAIPTSLPPIGGVLSNYVLLRAHHNSQNLLQLPGSLKENESDLQHIKRQVPDTSDGVVILAEPSQNTKMTEQIKEEPEGNQEEEQMGVQPGIAQSKPAAIALAGPGGMAQASPVGTALVGQGGLAVAAPSGTAVAGPAGQGSIPIHIGGEKQKKETTKKNEESDAY